MSDNIIQFPVKQPMRVFAATISNQAFFERQEKACQCKKCQEELLTSEMENQDGRF